MPPECLRTVLGMPLERLYLVAWWGTCQCPPGWAIGVGWSDAWMNGLIWVWVFCFGPPAPFKFNWSISSLCKCSSSYENVRPDLLLYTVWKSSCLSHFMMQQKENSVVLCYLSRWCDDGNGGGGVYRVWTHGGRELPHPSWLWTCSQEEERRSVSAQLTCCHLLFCLLMFSFSF